MSGHQFDSLLLLIPSYIQGPDKCTCEKYEGTAPTVLRRTIQVCVGELFSKIDASEKLHDKPTEVKKTSETVDEENAKGGFDPGSDDVNNVATTAESDLDMAEGKHTTPIYIPN